MTVPPSALFDCEGLHVSLGGRLVLSDVSVGVAAGEVLGIIGPNGAGKTTLFDVLSGRVRAQRGSVRLQGRDLSALPLSQRSRLGVARTYQSPTVPESISVDDVFKAARQAYAPQLTRHHAEQAARQARLRVPLDAKAGSLKTLNRRKLLLACLLMRQPKVLLMDEPAAGLIDSEIDELDSIIRYLAHELGMAVMLVEHRLELIAAITDRVVVLDVGEVIAEGPADAVFASPRVRAAYFDTPRVPMVGASGASPRVDSRADALLRMRHA